MFCGYLTHFLLLFTNIFFNAVKIKTHKIPLTFLVFGWRKKYLKQIWQNLTQPWFVHTNHWMLLYFLVTNVLKEGPRPSRYYSSNTPSSAMDGQTSSCAEYYSVFQQPLATNQIVGVYSIGNLRKNTVCIMGCICSNKTPSYSVAAMQPHRAIIRLNDSK